MVWLNSDPIVGSEQGGRRPAVVLSSTYLNARSPIIIVAPLTSKKTDNLYPYEAIVSSVRSGVATRSKALLTQLRAVSVTRIERAMGILEADELANVDRALLLAVGLVDIEP